MARRRKNDGTKELATMLTIMIFLGFFLIKWTIEAIVAIVKGIITFINWICKKSEQKAKKKKVNNIVHSVFDNSTIKPIPNIEVNDLKQKLGLFDKNIYDDLFETQIRRRGETYYSEKKIRNVRHNENKYTCIADGTDSYKVSITFNADELNKIESATCTCPYYTDKQKNCKHIYALLLKARCEENPLKIINEINNYTSKMSEMIEKANSYIIENQNQIVISEKDKYSFDSLVRNYEIKFKKYSEDLNKYKFNEEVLLRILEGIVEDSSILQTDIERILNSCNTDSTSDIKVNTNKEEKEKISFGDVAAGIFIADALDKHFNKDDEYDEELEKEMDMYALTDWQKEEVRKGNYDPWNFEEDGELEEDDYYYEDDK